MESKQITKKTFEIRKGFTWIQKYPNIQIWSNLIKSGDLIRFDQVWSDLIRFDQIGIFLYFLNSSEFFFEFKGNSGEFALGLTDSKHLVIISLWKRALIKTKNQINFTCTWNVLRLFSLFALDFFLFYLMLFSSKIYS